MPTANPGDRMEHALEELWKHVDLDYRALWAQIEPRMDPQRRAPLRWLPSSGTVRRALAVGFTGAAAVLVALVAFFAVPATRDSASAEVLRVVDEFGRTSRRVLSDGVLSPAELELVQVRLSLALERLSDDEAVTGLSVRQREHIVAVIVGVRTDLAGHPLAMDDAVFDAQLDAAYVRARALAGGPATPETVATSLPASATATGTPSQTQSAPGASATSAAAMVPVVSSTPEPQRTPLLPATTPPTPLTPAPTGTPIAATIPTPKPAATSTPSPSATPATPTSPTPTSTPTDAGSRFFVSGNPGLHSTDVGVAGTVSWEVLPDGRLQVGAVTSISGWIYHEEETEGSEIRVRFARGSESLTFEAERSDDQVKVSIEGGGASE
jgi:hypothetical protein